MIYGVKGSRKVKMNGAGDMLMTYCSNEVVMQREKSNFSTVMFGIGKLITIVQRVRCEMYV